MEDGAAVLEALFAAINDGDLDRLAELHSDEYVLVDEATGERYEGPAGARRNNEEWLRAFPDMKWELTNVVRAGEWGVVEATGVGTNTGPLAGRAPTGRRIELRILTIGRVRDGRLVEGRDYYDRSVLLRQLG